jgi:hypothetical protein
MLRNLSWLLVAASALPPRSAGAQATRVVADTQSYLLRITQQWGRNSPLGALAERRIGADDVEVRLWEGYGLGGSAGIVLRRSAGRWSLWEADMVRCMYRVPIAVGDTLTPPSIRRYQALARRRCAERNAGEADAPPGTYGWTVVSDDTVGLRPLRLRGRPEATWTALVEAGVLRLPPSVRRAWTMLDGHTYVLEVRQGAEYRASVIEHTSPPETAADSAMQAVAAIFRRVAPAGR